MKTPEEFLATELFPADETSGSYGAGIDQALQTSKKNYASMYRVINITSHSSLEVMHECARKWKFTKLIRTQAVEPDYDNGNIDFAFGHAVGAGIQTYLTSGSKQAALFASFLAWDIDLNLVHEKKKKSSPLATLAVEKFIAFWDSSFAEDWEVATFDGRPASELTFLVDLENGNYHVGHVDIILRNKMNGKYMVLELKTTSSRTPDEAQYGNSDQALSYSVVLDAIAGKSGGTGSFEVLYIVYSSTLRELTPIPFTKDRANRADWLQSLLLDHANINTWEKLGFFPKNGANCWKWNRRCQHYGVCDMRSYNDGSFKRFTLGRDPLPERVDFTFTLTELMNATSV